MVLFVSLTGCCPCTKKCTSCAHKEPAKQAVQEEPKAEPAAQEKSE